MVERENIEKWFVEPLKAIRRNALFHFLSHSLAQLFPGISYLLNSDIKESNV